MSAPGVRDTRMRQHLSTLSLALLLVGGLALMGYPLAEDLLWTQKSEEVVSRMSGYADLSQDPTRLATLRAAQHYNLKLGGEQSCVDNQGLKGSNEGSSDIACLATFGESCPDVTYDEQLVWNGISAICWLEIPSLALREPVFHGTSDGTLAQGVGHLAWSSLPVGGLSSHCVLAAHSGMERARLFDELGGLRPGDIFVLHTLGDAYAYKVQGSEVVLPEEAASRCAIVARKDLCTLMTCTPYGVNTHRLLVHGERTAYEPQLETKPPLKAYVNRRTVPLLGFATTAALVSAGSAVRGMLRAWRRRNTPCSYTGWRHRSKR